MKELSLDAKIENLGEVLEFLDEELMRLNCSFKIQTQLDIAVEEIFVNIAHYAYKPKTGSATIRLEIEEEPPAIAITFIDSGMPYNPLEKEDPDITLSAEERQIGGLGIYMVKKSMDNMVYRHENGNNILTITKKLS